MGCGSSTAAPVKAAGNPVTPKAEASESPQVEVTQPEGTDEPVARSPVGETGPVVGKEPLSPLPATSRPTTSDLRSSSSTPAALDAGWTPASSPTGPNKPEFGTVGSSPPHKEPEKTRLNTLKALPAETAKSAEPLDTPAPAPAAVTTPAPAPVPPSDTPQPPAPAPAQQTPKVEEAKEEETKTQGDVTKGDVATGESGGPKTEVASAVAELAAAVEDGAVMLQNLADEMGATGGGGAQAEQSSLVSVSDMSTALDSRMVDDSSLSFLCDSLMKESSMLLTTLDNTNPAMAASLVNILEDAAQETDSPVKQVLSPRGRDQASASATARRLAFEREQLAAQTEAESEPKKDKWDAVLVAPSDTSESYDVVSFIQLIDQATEMLVRLPSADSDGILSALTHGRSPLSAQLRSLMVQKRLDKSSDDQTGGKEVSSSASNNADKETKAAAEQDVQKMEQELQQLQQKESALTQELQTTEGPILEEPFPVISAVDTESPNVEKTSVEPFVQNSAVDLEQLLGQANDLLTRLPTCDAQEIMDAVQGGTSPVAGSLRASILQ